MSLGVSLRMSLRGATRLGRGAGVVERIVDELVGNALTYANGRIDVRVDSTDSDVVVQVDDDGPGIDEGEWQTVFQRFARGTNSVPGGSGLGLALVCESAQALGGSATAGRPELGGLSVRMQFPASQDPTD